MKANKATVVVPKKSAGRGEATTVQQKELMVIWLESDHRNFNLIVGNGAANYKGIVAGAKLKKCHAYEALRVFVNNECEDGTNWTLKNTSARFKAYLKNYQEVAREVRNKCGEKFGLSESDKKKGIISLEQKKESMCTFYTRLDALFGDRQNVTPSHTMEPSPPPVISQPVFTYGFDGDNDSDSGSDGENMEEAEDEENEKDGDFEEEWQEEQSAHYSSCMSPSFYITSSLMFIYFYFTARPLLDIDALLADNVSAVATNSSSAASPPVAAVVSTKTPRSSSKKRPAKEISADLQTMASDVVGESSPGDLADKLTGFKQDSKNQKKDFSTVFALGKAEELKLERDKFEFTKRNFDRELLLKEHMASNELALRKEGFRVEDIRATRAQLVALGKTAAEIKVFLLDLFE
jgi:hypothetical protein